MESGAHRSLRADDVGIMDIDCQRSGQDGCRILCPFPTWCSGWSVGEDARWVSNSSCRASNPDRVRMY